MNILPRNAARLIAILIIASSAWCKEKGSTVTINSASNAASDKKGGVREKEPDIVQSGKVDEKEKGIYERFPEARWNDLHPKVKAAIERIMSEMGGGQNLLRLSSFSYESAVEFGGIRMKAKNYWLAPGSFRSEFDNGDVLQISGGDIFYEVSGVVVHEPLPEEKERLSMSVWARYIGTNLPLKGSDLWIEMEEEEAVFKTRTLKFKIRSESAKRTVFVYFDRLSFKLIALDYNTKFKGNNIRVVERFSDYKTVSNIALPFSHEVTFYNATDYKYGRKVLKETILSVDLTPVEKSIFKRSGKIVDDSIFFADFPERLVALANLKTSGKKEPLDIDEFLMSLKKEGIFPLLLPVILYQKKSSMETLLFSPFSMIGFTLQNPPFEEPDIERMFEGIFVTVSETNFPSYEEDRPIKIKLLKASKNACLFHKFPNDGDIAKIERALISLKDRVTEKGFLIAGKPVMYLDKSNFYDNSDKSKDNLLRLCYPITSEKK